MTGRGVICIPFVPEKLYAQTFEWSKARPDVLPWPIRLDDWTAYWRMLSHAWQELGDLAVVEHDMLPADGVVEEMLACPAPWCTSPYRASPNRNEPDLIEGLGCTKFSEALKLRESDLMRVVGEIAEPGLPAKIWKRLDVRIARVLRTRKYAPHTHKRSTHLHYDRADRITLSPAVLTSDEVNARRAMIGNVPPFPGWGKCSKPDCFRKVKVGVAFCCHSCSYAAEKKFEIHDDGPLGHTADCNERDKVRGTIGPHEAFFYKTFE